jgi:Protein of unknown function (DUF1553)/Protein of unknown function (DUF1549)/Bacterial Ig-like domain (group 2)
MRVSRTRTRWVLISFVLTTASSIAGNGWAADQTDAKPPAAKLKRITLSPDKIVLTGSRNTQGLRVTGEYSDGTFRDLTGECKFGSADTAIAEVSEKGVVHPKANGAVTITATFQKANASTPLTVTRVEDKSYNFRHDVLPVLSRWGCNEMGCHGSPKGKKRLHLSLFSAKPHKDYLEIVDKKKKLIDPSDPDQSLLLLKAIGDEEHGGGDLAYPDTPEYDLVADWIRNNAPEGSEDAPELVSVNVSPSERDMLPGDKQRLLVEAYYSDGSMRDVTELASFKSNEEAVASVNDMGLVKGTGYGGAIFMIGYGSKLTTSRVTSSQPLTVEFPEVPINNKVDELVLAKLRTLNVIPSELCTDFEFLRRAYLDVIGALPTAEEARAFLTDTNPDKRKYLIDALLERPEYADFYALKWGDVLQISRRAPAQLQDKGMWTYYRWLWDAIDQNKPMDQFVHEVLTARGSGYRNGPANFFRVGEGPQGMAEHASTAFLGVRLDCAHCHNHPFEQFTLIDNLGMAAFFTTTRIKRSQEQDEEIIYIADSGSIKNPETNKPASPKFLAGVELAAAEKAAAAIADDEKAAADKIAAQTTAVAKAAIAKAKAVKAANDKLVATKTAVAKKAIDASASARAVATKAVAEVAAAKKDAAAKVQAAKAAADKIVADKVAAAKVATDQAAVLQAAADKAATEVKAEEANTEKVAAAKKAAELSTAAKLAADKASADVAAAQKEVPVKTQVAKAAADKIVAAKEGVAKTATDKAAAMKLAADKANVDKAAAQKVAADQATANNAVVAKANGEKSAAAKIAAVKTAAAKSAAAAVVAVETTGDLRAKLADWIASPENPYFSKHMANRVWTWLVGRGIVDEPDDFRSTNPASNPELLDYLANEFVSSGYDMKAMFRLILNSRTYQLSAEPNQWNKHDRIHFSYYGLKRLTAEQLADAICQVTGVDEKYAGLPLGTRATQLPDVSMRSEFLDLFGRPKRATPVESERTCDTHIGQSLQMISSEYMARKLRDNNGHAAKLAASGKSFPEVVDELYLSTLSRFPTDAERQVILSQPIIDAQRREKIEDLAWVLMNTKEFLFNH